MPKNAGRAKITPATLRVAMRAGLGALTAKLLGVARAVPAAGE